MPPDLRFALSALLYVTSVLPGDVRDIGISPLPLLRRANGPRQDQRGLARLNG